MLKKYIDHELGRVHWQKMYNDIGNEILSRVVEENNKLNVQHLLYDLLNNISEYPKCGNIKCSNKVKFSGHFTIGYRRFCCIKCSKNEEETSKITLKNNMGKKKNVKETEKHIYFKKVRNITRLTYSLYKEIINPNDVKLGRAGIKGAYQIDHIISVYEGYNKGIAAEIIGGVDNLRVVPWRVNSVKNKFINTEITVELQPFIKSDFKNHSQICTEKEVTDFLHKFCIDKSGRVNTKITAEWFKTRGINNILQGIYSMTGKIDELELIPYRVSMILYGLNLSSEKITSNRASFMRYLHNPTIDWVKLTGNDELDFRANFMCFDKRINRFRLKSVNKNYRSFLNKKGLLFLFYKYNTLRDEYKLNT